MNVKLTTCACGEPIYGGWVGCFGDVIVYAEHREMGESEVLNLREFSTLQIPDVIEELFMEILTALVDNRTHCYER